jgi:hypothetical protein
MRLTNADDQPPKERPTPGRHTRLRVRRGTVIGKLTREEIYEDIGRLGPEDAPKE